MIFFYSIQTNMVFNRIRLTKNSIKIFWSKSIDFLFCLKHYINPSVTFLENETSQQMEDTRDIFSPDSLICENSTRISNITIVVITNVVLGYT